MELVTGRKGSAHITSQQDRMKHQGMFGEGAYILKTGQMLEPQVQTSNEIRIRDGALMVQGALSCVKTNSYDAVTIQNGTQGMKRIDLICWQYTYDAEQDVESAEWVVIQGTPAASDPQQPSYTDGDIQQGDSPVQVPVFAVELDGINVTGVTTLLPTAPTLEELNDKLQGLLSDPENIDLDLNTSQFTSNTTWAQRAGREVKVYPYVVGTPINGRTICTGLPKPPKQIILRDASFGVVQLATSGIMSVLSAGSSSSTYFAMPFSYWAAE